jgi:hypothetical protein
MCMGRRPNIREPLAETLEEVKQENDYSSLGAAMTHIAREAGYDI